MFLKNINNIKLTENLTTVLMPILWVEEVSFSLKIKQEFYLLFYLQGVSLNAESVNLIKSKLINVLTTLKMVHWASVSLGVIILILSIIFYIVLKKVSTGETEK